MTNDVQCWHGTNDTNPTKRAKHNDDKNASKRPSKFKHCADARPRGVPVELVQRKCEKRTHTVPLMNLEQSTTSLRKDKFETDGKHHDRDGALTRTKFRTTNTNMIKLMMTERTIMQSVMTKRAIIIKIHDDQTKKQCRILCNEEHQIAKKTK